jgi:hypothetical protein
VLITGGGVRGSFGDVRDTFGRGLRGCEEGKGRLVAGTVRGRRIGGGPCELVC